MFFKIFSCFQVSKTKKVREKKDLETECTICMDEMKEDDDYVTECCHRFHKDCLFDWISLHSNTQCPNCRKEIGLYVLETKKERKTRLKKEEYERKIKKEEEELERLVLERREREKERIKRKRKKQKNLRRRRQFIELLKSFDIKLKKRNLDVDFINCCSLKKFVSQFQYEEGEEITGICNFCNKNTFGKIKIYDHKIYHYECYRIYNCSRRHIHF